MNILRTFSFFILVLSGFGAFAQQLALGKSPFVMNKSAILELNADNQGFLLPRISDTTLINGLAPPDGMVIYFSPSKQVMVRTNGYWKGLAPTGNYITGLTGDLSATGPGTVGGTVTGIRGASIPGLTSGFLKYNGTAWVFDNAPFTLQQVTTYGNTSDIGVDLTFKGNAATVYALKLIRSKDQNPNGYFIRGTASDGATNIFTVDASANLATSGSISVGVMTPATSLDVKGDIAMRMVAFTALNGVNNDINVGKSTSVRIGGPTAAFSVTGIANGVDGRLVILYNSTDYDMTLTHDASSNSSNRIYCSDNTNIVVKKKGCATLMYSAADLRWIVVSTR